MTNINAKPVAGKSGQSIAPPIAPAEGVAHPARCAGSSASMIRHSHSECGQSSIRPRRPTRDQTRWPIAPPASSSAPATSARQPNASTPAASGTSTPAICTPKNRRASETPGGGGIKAVAA